MSAGNTAGDSLGDKVKGVANILHGSGEAIRGNVNSFVDNVGEQIAGRGDNTAATGTTGATGHGAGATGNSQVLGTGGPAVGENTGAHSMLSSATTDDHARPIGHAGQNNEGVAAKGVNEFQKGLDQLKRD